MNGVRGHVSWTTAQSELRHHEHQRDLDVELERDVEHIDHVDVLDDVDRRLHLRRYLPALRRHLLADADVRRAALYLSAVRQAEADQTGPSLASSTREAYVPQRRHPAQ